MLSVALRTTARVNAACFSTVDVRPYAVHLSAVGVAFRTTARVNAPYFSAVGISFILPNLPFSVPPLPVRLGLILSDLRRWYTRSAAHFTAVGVAFRTTARVNAAYCSAVGIGVILPISPRLVPPFTVRLEQILPVLRPWV